MDTDCEIIWCKLNIIGCRTLYLGSFYRPPNQKPEIEQKYLKAFNSSLTRIMSNKNAHVLVGVTSIVVILSGALCRYPKGYRTGVYKVNFWKSRKSTVWPK